MGVTTTDFVLLAKRKTSSGIFDLKEKRSRRDGRKYRFANNAYIVKAATFTDCRIHRYDAPARPCPPSHSVPFGRTRATIAFSLSLARCLSFARRRCRTERDRSIRYAIAGRTRRCGVEPDGDVCRPATRPHCTMGPRGCALLSYLTAYHCLRIDRGRCSCDRMPVVVRAVIVVVVRFSPRTEKNPNSPWSSRANGSF